MSRKITKIDVSNMKREDIEFLIKQSKDSYFVKAYEELEEFIENEE